MHARLLQSGIILPSEVIEPETATWNELALVHTQPYLAKMRDAALTLEDQAQLQLPWSPTIADGFRAMVGGTADAALLALGLSSRRRADSDSQRLRPDFELPAPGFRVACHIGGGLHHAFPSHGEGFCPFNDVAIATRIVQSRGIERVAIVDLDVHHGNGTAFIFESDPRVFTLSMHQQNNYPAWKPRGSLDIGLADGVDDGTFMRRLTDALPLVAAFDPQCVFYLAGADPYEDDQLGGLRLSRAGLRERDRLVIEAASRAGHPLVIVLAGGYARRTDDTIAIHVATIEEAKRACPR